MVMCIMFIVLLEVLSERFADGGGAIGCMVSLTIIIILPNVQLPLTMSVTTAITSSTTATVVTTTVVTTAVV